MTHIVQMSIDVDDENIRKSVEKRAEAEIIEELKRNIGLSIFDEYKAYYRRSDFGNCGLSNVSKAIVKEFLDENKDRIIELSAKYIADRLSRTKAAKALIGGADNA